MSDYGRYGSTSQSRPNRERGFGDYDRDRSRRGRGDESMFGSWSGERDRERGWRSEGGRGNERSWRERGWGGEHEGERGRGRERERGGREGNYYGYDDYHEGLAIDETSHLIASNKVEGTPVYGRDGDKLGSIYNFMVDKYSGKVKYAVMSYGGFLGMGQHYFPLPWDILDYDVREGGYHVDMTERDLERAPSFNRENEPVFDRDYDRRVGRFYGTS